MPSAADTARLCTPATQPHASRRSPGEPQRPRTAHHGAPGGAHRNVGRPSRGTRGPTPSAPRLGRRRGPRGSGEATRPRTEPHVPPGGQPFPARVGGSPPGPGPGPLLPPGGPAVPPQRPPSGRRRGRVEESPAGSARLLSASTGRPGDHRAAGRG